MFTTRTLTAICGAALVAVLGLSGCGQQSNGTPSNGTQSNGSQSNGPLPTTAQSDAVLATVPVYYLGEERIWREGDGQPVDRIRLYREFHQAPAGDGGAEAKAAAAITVMLGEGSAFDPDYGSGWPAVASLREVSIDGDAVTVDLSGASTNNVGAEAAQQAVQQLIWTATAASGKPGVRLLLDGEPVTELWGHVAVSGVLKRAAALGTIAQLWLIDPQHGAALAPTFTVHVTGSVYESTVQLRVRQGDRTVSEKFVTLAGGSENQFGEAKTTMTLAPGSYVVEAYAESAVDGRVSFLDNHTITVG